jgi:outer membrane lipoprotein
MRQKLALFAVAGVGGCSVIAPDVRAVAEPEAPYREILETADAYAGKTVILGGYVLEVDPGADESVMILLHAPLDSFEAPGDTDDSEGRIVVFHRGYLDPAVYREGRQVTLAGVVGGVIEQTDECPARCIQVETRDLHLWEAQSDSTLLYLRAHPYPLYRYWPMTPYDFGPRIYRIRRHPETKSSAQPLERPRTQPLE